jgi:hypothetical protein
MEMKNKGTPESEMAKGNDQERRGELELPMASKNNCKGERQ